MRYSYGILMISCMLMLVLIINCQAYVAKKTTTDVADMYAEELLSTNAQQTEQTSKGHITKLGQSRDVRMPISYYEIATFVEGNFMGAEGAAKLKQNDDSAAAAAATNDEEQPTKILSYKDLCKMLGNWHITNEKNRYDMQVNSKGLEE